MPLNDCENRPPRPAVADCSADPAPHRAAASASRPVAAAPCGAGIGTDAGPDARARIRVEYRWPGTSEPCPRDLLAAVSFGASAATVHGVAVQAPVTVDVHLTPLHDAPVELWLASGPVRAGSDGPVRYAHDANFLFAAIELDEREHGGVRASAEAAYVAIQRFQERSDFAHPLRMWNYLDAINDGAGDLERYRQFCVGRARGLGAAAHQRHPAATAIGRQHGTHPLQVFWLAGRAPGLAIENPRQVSAYHYPRAHGPVSPSFSRATLAPDGTMLISGTASIVGHDSRHHDDTMEQLEEILRNLAALAQQARVHRAFARPSRELLKVYVREPALMPQIAQRVREEYPSAHVVFLAADVCRRELLLEIEAVYCP